MNAASRWFPGACLLALASCTCAPTNSSDPRLSVELAGNGVGFVTSTPSGINCPGTCDRTMPAGTEVTLNAAPSVAGTTFVGWSGPCAGLEPCRLTLQRPDGAHAIAAFALRNSLVVTRVGTGRGTVLSEPAGIDCGADCSELFPPETEVTLTAPADPGSTFEGWSGACEGKSPCVVRTEQAQLVTATFAAITVPLTVELLGAGKGSIASTPAGLACSTSQCVAQFRVGTQVTLRASSQPGSTFAGWGGGCGGSSPSCTFNLNEATSVTGRFEPANSTLGITPSMAVVPVVGRLSFVAFGGTLPYVFSVRGSGVIDQLGLYTAPGFGTTETVVVRDARGSTAEAMVRVSGPPPILLPTMKTLAHGETFSFVAVGGVPPYVFSIQGPIAARHGTVDQSGRYTAPPYDASVVLRVTDAAGAFAEAQVTTRGVGDAGVSSDAGFAIDAGFFSDAGFASDAGLFAPAAGIGINLPREVITGDWNGDGQADVAVQNDNALTIMVRSGNTFILRQTVTQFGAHPIAADWNRDGKLDIAAGDIAGANVVQVLLGVGDGTFQPATARSVGSAFTDSTTADFNRDGLLDLGLSFAFPGGLSILLGQGDGTFQPPLSIASVGDCSSLTSGDWNRDGKGDLALTCAPNVVKLLAGVGDGTFGTAVALPAVQSPDTVTACELNADGVTDLVVSGAAGALSRYLGSGDGTFLPSFTVSPNGPDAASSIAVGDWDNDGKVDLAVAQTTSAYLDIFLGNGDGTFRSSTLPPPGPGWIASLDWNRDGRPDLVVTNTTANALSVLVNESPHLPPVFQRRDTVIGNQPFWLLADDWNRDGKVDLAITDATAAGVSLGQGDGTFVTAPSLVTGFSMATASGDWNRDGRPDVAVASGPITFFLGAGDGGFATGSTVDGGVNPSALVTGDWNRDGQPDLATDDVNGVRLLLGAGDGTFPTILTFDAGVSPGAVVTGDWNRDGKLDLAVASQSSNQVTVLLGRGDGTFQPPVDYAAGQSPLAICASDLNRDGAPDLVVALNTQALDTHSVGIFLGVGDGTFVVQAPLEAGGSAWRVLCGNWNADGWPDIAVAKQGTLTLLLGGGDGGTFAPVNFPLSGVGGLTSADWNGDGKPDLAVAQPSVNTITFFLSRF